MLKRVRISYQISKNVFLAILAPACSPQFSQQYVSLIDSEQIKPAMDDIDLDLGEWDGAIDELLAAPETTTADDSMAADPEPETETCDLGTIFGDWDFLTEETPEQGAASSSTAGRAEDRETQLTSQQPESSVTSVPSRHMYGSIDDLFHLASPVQKGMFANFCSGVVSRACPNENVLHLEHEYVHSKTMKSVAAVESFTGIHRRSITRGLIHYACTLLYGATLLIGAFFLAWTRVFTTGQQFEPVVAIWKRKYDETPLKMKVREHNHFFGTSLPERESEKPYLHSKILRIECSVSFLTSALCCTSILLCYFCTF